MFARGWGGGQSLITKGRHEGNFWSHGTALCPDCGSGYTNVPIVNTDRTVCPKRVNFMVC